jgi:cobyrinic acid a,c-diamide synthase
MFSKSHKIPQKFFVIRTYNKLSKIETVVDRIAQKNKTTLQLSVLGKLTNKQKITKKELQKSVAEIQQELSVVLAEEFKFGYFYNSEIGFLFIAGHLTSTFLNKVNERELASLPAGLLGIFRGLDAGTAEINNYFTDLKNDNYCLIIRGESNALKNIEPSLRIF